MIICWMAFSPEAVWTEPLKVYLSSANLLVLPASHVLGQRAAGRLLGLAARRVFGRVRVVALGAVVVAVGEREVGARRVAERARALVLAAGDGAAVLDVGPRGVDLATLAAVGVGAEADGLGRDRHLERGLGGDAHAVRGGFCAAEGPAAAAVGLVADIAEDLGAGGPVGLRVEGVGDRGGGVLGDELLELAGHDGGGEVLAVVALGAMHEKLTRHRVNSLCSAT